MQAWEELALACTGALVVVACIEASLWVGKPVSLVVGVLVDTWVVSSVGVEVCIEASVGEVVSSGVGVVACTGAFVGEVVSSVVVGHTVAEDEVLQGSQLNLAELAEAVGQEWDHLDEAVEVGCTGSEEEPGELHIHQLGVLQELRKSQQQQQVQVQEEPVGCHSYQELAQPQLLVHVHVNDHENVHHRHGLGQKPE